MGKIFGASEVVPPPPSVHSNAPSNAGTSLAANIVPPPPTVGANSAAGNPHVPRNGAGSSLGANVVAPPPSSGFSGGVATRSASSSPALGAPTVVPPPPSLSGPGGAGAPAGTLLANNVVPPPPSLGGGASPVGPGLGRKGAALGAPVDAGAGLAPPNTAGSGANAGAVISSQPGPKVGLPSSGGTGSLALSPTGGDKPGLGGAGGGTSIGRGKDSGSGMNGTGPGAGRSNSGRGSDADAHGGISPSPGPGGAGNAPAGNPPVRGVDISGGSTIVNLPSFGSDPSSPDVSAPGHSAAKPRQTLGVTIVATATSGGAFEPYKNLLHGQTYTTYFDTSLGSVVMQFSEAVPSNQAGGLTAPQSVRTDLPDGLPRARMVISCTLDASGNLKNLRVREAGSADMTAKILSALRSWKFQPALRGDQPVEVTAILGFGIDTNDRF
jgi:TonB family protein